MNPVGQHLLRRAAHLIGLLLLAIMRSGLAAEAASPVHVAPGVYVLPGAAGDAAADNAGRIANTGFIIGAGGVIVIDSGASRQHGEAILAAIRRITDLPLRLLINTHPQPEFVLGNSAFAERKVPILSSAATAMSMQKNCAACLQALTRSAGVAAMQDTLITLPQKQVAASSEISVAGRRLQLLVFPHAHTEGDMAVLDLASGVVFAGDLVYAGQIPHVARAGLPGWFAALDELEKRAPARIVPGRGPLDEADALERTRDYLARLQAVVAREYQRGASLNEALESAALPEYASRPGYRAHHEGNVQRLYLLLDQ